MELNIIERQKNLLNSFCAAYDDFSDEKKRIEVKHDSDINNANKVKKEGIMNAEKAYDESIQSIEKLYSDRKSKCITFRKIIHEMWSRVSQETKNTGLGSWCVSLGTVFLSNSDNNIDQILSNELPASIKMAKERLVACSIALSKYTEYLRVKRIAIVALSIGIPLITIGLMIYFIILTSNFIQIIFKPKPESRPVVESLSSTILPTLNSQNSDQNTMPLISDNSTQFSPPYEASPNQISITPNPTETSYEGNDGATYVKQMLKYAMNNGGIDSEVAIVETVYALNKKFPCPVQQYKKNARAANNEALKFNQTNNIDQALQKFQEAYDIDSTDIEIVNNLGYGYLKAGNYRKAEDFLLQTLIYEPGRSAAWANLGELYAKTGDTQAAKAAFANTLRFSRDTSKTLVFFNSLVEKNSDPNVREVAKFALQLPYIEPKQIKFCRKGD